MSPTYFDEPEPEPAPEPKEPEEEMTQEDKEMLELARLRQADLDKWKERLKQDPNAPPPRARKPKKEHWAKRRARERRENKD